MLSWIPSALLAAIQVAVWSTFLFAGGMRAVVAWALLLSLVPLAGAIAGLAAGARAL